MTNKMSIEGEAKDVPDPLTGLPLDLRTSYNGKSYALASLTGIIPLAMVFHLSRQDGQQIPGELNTVVLMTTGKGRYQATGISLYDRGDGAPTFFTLGSDLELDVTESANSGIKNLASML